MFLCQNMCCPGPGQRRALCVDKIAWWSDGIRRPALMATQGIYVPAEDVGAAHQHGMGLLKLCRSQGPFRAG